MDKEVVVVAGTPGVGKTTVGRLLAKAIGAEFIDVPELVKTHRVYEYYDRKSRAYVVDVRKLEKVLNQLIERSGKDRVVIASHIIPRINGRRKRVKVVVLRLNPLRLIQRLSRRGYPRRKAIANAEAEFTAVVYSDALKLYTRRRLMQIDTTGKSPRAVVKRILENLSDEVDWMSSLREDELNRLLRLFARYHSGK